jgi:hypothetical protein
MGSAFAIEPTAGPALIQVWPTTVAVATGVKVAVPGAVGMGVLVGAVVPVETGVMVNVGVFAGVELAVLIAVGVSVGTSGSVGVVVGVVGRGWHSPAVVSRQSNVWGSHSVVSIVTCPLVWRPPG